MLVLCHSSRQVVGAPNQREGTDMIAELLRKRQRVADQSGHALVQCLVEVLDMIGPARQRADRLVLRCGDHPAYPAYCSA
jgi:hypothetical protein